MTLPLTTVQGLIERAQAGDSAAFEELIGAHSLGLYRVVRRFCSDEAETEEVMQEAFWRTWRSLERYHNDRPFFPYLVTIAVRLVRDRWRKSKWLADETLDGLEQVLADGEPLPEEAAILQEREWMLGQVLQALPQHYRVVIALRYQAGYSYEKIAEMMEIPLNTVRTYLYRAKQMLRRKMEEQGETDG